MTRALEIFAVIQLTIVGLSHVCIGVGVFFLAIALVTTASLAGGG